MNRRTALKLMGKLGLLSLPFGSRVAKALGGTEWNWEEPDLVLITDTSAFPHQDLQALLLAAEPVLENERPDWRRSLVVWDIRSDAAAVRRFLAHHAPNTENLLLPVLVSVPELGADEVQLWTMDWMRSRAERETGKCYPISGNWWSVDGDWNPTVSKVKDHLFKSPNHKGGKFELPWLELLKLAELQSLHSDHHREMTGEGKVHWGVVNCCPMRIQD